MREESLIFILKVLNLIAPWKNQTAAQKVGTVCTIVAMLAGFVGYIATNTPPVIKTPGMVDPVLDDVPDAKTLQDAPGVPVEASQPVGMEWTAFIPFVGCNPHQVASWRAFGNTVKDCLIQKCHLAADVIDAMQGGAFINIAVSELPAVMACLGEGISGIIQVQKAEGLTAVAGKLMAVKAGVPEEPVLRLRIKKD